MAAQPWGGRTAFRPPQHTPDRMSKLRQEAGRIAAAKVGYHGVREDVGGGYTRVRNGKQQLYLISFREALRRLEVEDRASSNWQLPSAPS